jgi:hypothetical protein
MVERCLRLVNRVDMAEEHIAWEVIGARAFPTPVTRDLTPKLLKMSCKTHDWTHRMYGRNDPTAKRLDSDSRFIKRDAKGIIDAAMKPANPL